MPWAIEWSQTDRPPALLGKYFATSGDDDQRYPDCPLYMSGYTLLVFERREDARAFIKRRFAFLRRRPDLRRPPHNWRMPQPVKVNIEVSRA